MNIKFVSKIDTESLATNFLSTTHKQDIILAVVKETYEITCDIAEVDAFDERLAALAVNQSTRFVDMLELCTRSLAAEYFELRRGFFVERIKVLIKCRLLPVNISELGAKCVFKLRRVACFLVSKPEEKCALSKCLMY